MTNKKNKYKDYDLLSHAVYAEDTERILLLISSGIDINCKDSYGRTVLSEVVGRSNEKMIHFLCNNGADVNTADKGGKTPLHFTCIDNNLAIAKLLIERGAIVDSVDKNGNTPLSDAVFACKGDVKLVNYLVEHGADKMIKNNYGNSPKSLADQFVNYNIPL